MVLPQKLERIEACLERVAEVKPVMMDRTERPIQRPQDPEAHKANYSGNKKRHTRKHLAAVNQNKRVLILSQVRAGKLQYQRFYEHDDIAGSIRAHIPIEVDLGFLGWHKQAQNIHLPHRQPQGRQLCSVHKQETRAWSQSPVVCENAFALC